MHCRLGLFCRKADESWKSCRSQGWHVQGLRVMEPHRGAVLRQAEVAMHERGMSPHLPIIASPATFRSMHNLCGHGVQDGTAEGCHGLLWK